MFVRMEPVSKQTPFLEYGKFHFLIVIASGLSIMGAIMENISVSYVLPYAKCDLQLTLTEQGLVNSVSFLGFVLSSHFWGFMADTWGRQKVIRTALILGFVSSFVSAFSIDTNMLLITRLCTGLLYVKINFHKATFQITPNVSASLAFKRPDSLM